ncbi:carbohydrate ABC transporter permease [Falsibacillus albus]|nr:carbohydrate ABC transporter permease [Falsibacillus albus]
MERIKNFELNRYYLRAKRFFIGMQGTDGLLIKILIYGLLIGIGFVYLFPMIYMGVYSLKTLDDLLNPLVNWIPTKLYWGNYSKADQVLSFFPTLFETLYVTVLPSVVQTAVAAVVGYGFARFEFKGKKILFALVLATFVIPPQVTLIPRYIFFNELHILGSLKAFLLPAAFGQGINSAIFILIFFQFFRQVPKALEEAAQIDGAGHFRIFFTIALPMAVPAFIISFLFSFVWYWNETYLAAIYFGDALTTLPLQLQKFVATYQKMFPAGMGLGENQLNEGIKMAGTLLSILPLLIVYFITQRWFVEGVDRSGITGE